jgi:hypothetical protein
MMPTGLMRRVAEIEPPTWMRQLIPATEVAKPDNENTMIDGDLDEVQLWTAMGEASITHAGIGPLGR